MSQHHFDTFLAEIYGIESAIMINNIDFWIHRNLINGDGIFLDKPWTTFSAESMNKYFTYWDVRKIRRILLDMVKNDILITEQFRGVNRVKSYTFTTTFLKEHGRLLNLYSFFQQELGVVEVADLTTHYNNISSIMPISVPDTRFHGLTTSSENTISAEEFKYLKYFEYWNSKENLTTHAIPNKIGGSCTKTVKKGISILQEILDQTFFENKKLTVDKTITEAMILETIDTFNIVKLPEYLPYNKSGLADSLPNFLYNTRTFNSNLLEFMGQTPTKVHKLESIPGKITEDYLSLFGGDISNQHKAILPNKIQELYNVYMSNKHLCNFSTNYDFVLGTTGAFFNVHLNYLKTYTPVTIGHLNTYGKVWDRFKAWLKDTHHVEIEIPQQKFELMKKRRRQTLIEKGLKTSKDFDEHSNLKGETHD